MRILYAANNTFASGIQLNRFFNAIGNKHTIKIAAYKKSSPSNVPITWTLDALIRYGILSINIENLSFYLEQIKIFAPDLIISDLEIITSRIANTLNIPLWHCSSSMLNHALSASDKHGLGLYKYNALTVNNNNEFIQTVNVLDNADKNFVYSHFADINNPPPIKPNFEWIRPYTKLGKINNLCQHNIVAAHSTNNKNIHKMLKSYQDCVIFGNFTNESYSNIILKNLKNQNEYFCNIANCNLFICEGETSFLADSFYNKKYSVILPDFSSPECIVNSVFSEKYKLSTCIYKEQDLNDFMHVNLEPAYNENVKFLHEKIEDL